MAADDMHVTPDERIERIKRAHQRRVREQLWLPRNERATICARCTLVKESILTLQLDLERFGLCARCLETLWSIVSSDD